MCCFHCQKTFLTVQLHFIWEWANSYGKCVYYLLEINATVELKLLWNELQVALMMYSRIYPRSSCLFIASLLLLYPHMLFKFSRGVASHNYDQSYSHLIMIRAILPCDLRLLLLHSSQCNNNNIALNDDDYNIVTG